jgi:prepilin-type N-terminal cleavage/methylation domain-containing protein
VVPQRIRRSIGAAAGFTMAELLVVVAVIGVTVGVAIPSLWTYYRSAALRSGGEQTVAILNSARQMAIRLNSTFCVTYDATGLQYHKDTCASGGYAVSGTTDAAGYMYLPSGLSLSGTNNFCFGYLGAAPSPLPAGCNSNGTLTVTRAAGGSINVIVASTGRVRLQ